MRWITFILLLLICSLASNGAGLPDNADACLKLYYFQRHTNDAPMNAWRLEDSRDGNGIRIAEWRLADPKPTDAQVIALTNAVAAHVESRKSDTTTWTRRERFMMEALYQLNQKTTNAMTRPQFRIQMKAVWDSTAE